MGLPDVGLDGLYLLMVSFLHMLNAYLDSCRRLLRTSPDQMADALKLHGSQLSTCSVILDNWTVGQSSWTLDMRHYFFRDSLPVFQEFMHESRHLKQFEFVVACIDS